MSHSASWLTILLMLVGLGTLSLPCLPTGWPRERSPSTSRITTMLCVLSAEMSGSGLMPVLLQLMKRFGDNFAMSR